MVQLQTIGGEKGSHILHQCKRLLGTDGQQIRLAQAGLLPAHGPMAQPELTPGSLRLQAQRGRLRCGPGQEPVGQLWPAQGQGQSPLVRRTQAVGLTPENHAAVHACQQLPHSAGVAGRQVFDERCPLRVLAGGKGNDQVLCLVHADLPGSKNI